MAVLYITECANMGQTSNGQVAIMAPFMPPVAEQNVSIAGASAQSAAFNAATKFVMVHTDAICALAWGSNPTAVTTAQRLAANETRFYAVNPGTKVAVISAT